MSFDSEYILIVDTDADRIAAAVRGCGDALPIPTVVARNGDDAIRILKQLGSPVVLMTALTLPGPDGFLVIESLHRIDENAPVIAWTTDRDLREYAVSHLARTRAKVLGRSVSSEVCRRCLDALLAKDDEAPLTPTVPVVEDHEVNWLDLAERARQGLHVAGAAAYTKAHGDAEYRWSVSWRPDTPMPNFPVVLSSALEEVVASGVSRVWADLVDESSQVLPNTASASLRSLAIVPIMRDGEMTGALCAFDSAPDALGDEDLETLSAFASHSPARQPGPTLPVDRTDADTIIKRELARAGRDQRQLTVIVFAITAHRTHDLPGVGDVFAAAVRGNDTVIRWTSAEVLVVLSDVDRSVAERVAERIRGTVETKTANMIAVNGAVTDVRATDSFEDTVARTSKRLQKTVRGGRPRIA